MHSSLKWQLTPAKAWNTQMCQHSMGCASIGKPLSSPAVTSCSGLVGQLLMSKAQSIERMPGNAWHQTSRGKGGPWGTVAHIAKQLIASVDWSKLPHICPFLQDNNSFKDMAIEASLTLIAWLP